MHASMERQKELYNKKVHEAEYNVGGSSLAMQSSNYQRIALPMDRTLQDIKEAFSSGL